MSYLGRSAKLSLKAQEKVSFLATAGQTVKTGLSYTPSFIDVYVNGVLLTDTTDFTATNGNSVTFTVALLLNDEVTVISLKTFTVADHYSKTEADTLLAAKSPLASPSFTGNVGIGTSSPAGKLHVKTSASGATAVAGADDLVIEHADYGGMSILSENEGHIYFGDNEDADVGRIEYQHGANAMVFRTNAADAMTIDGAGIVTKPKQPCFQATATSTQSNKTVNQQHTILFAGETFDNNNNFSSNTFTAPVTGKYYLTTNVRLDNLDISASYYQLWMVTSNRNYVTILSMNGFDADVTLYTLTLNVLADMDAGDTAVINFNQASGAAQTDIDGDAKYTNFSGYLVC